MIKYLVMDADGTLTDGKIYMGKDGEIFKAFDVKDGCGIKDILIPKGIIPIVITARESSIVTNRCKELNITEVHQGVSDKLEKLINIISRYSEEIDFSHIAYIGDDIPDLKCMIPVKKGGGLIGCPKNAVKEIRNIADFISDHDGGNGAVRDFIEWILFR